MPAGTLLQLESDTPHKIQPLKILVDGFLQRFKHKDTVNTFILTHFHSDHTYGLDTTFQEGIIYTPITTRDLIVEVTGVKKEYVRGV